MQFWVLNRRIHVSWLIAAASLAFVVGTATAASLPLSPLSAWVVGVAGLAVEVLGLWRRRLLWIPLLVVGGMMIGWWRGSLAMHELERYRPFYGTYVRLSGVVGDDPVKSDSGRLRLAVERGAVGERSLAGSVWIELGAPAPVKRSDQIVVEGRLDEGFGTFPAMMYRARVVEVARSPADDPGRVVRDWFAAAVRTAIPEPQASLGIGYLTGQKSALPPDLADALVVVGLTHVVVASGYNLTILVRLARRLFARVSKYASTLAAALMVAAFITVTGLSPSMSRAGLVAALSLAAWYYGRRFHPFVLLPFAAAVTVAVQPSYAWGDVGWQLSFAAFAGVMVIAPLLQRFFFGESQLGVIRQVLGETVAAHLATVPIVVLSFGVLSNVAIPANMLVVPLVPLAMLLTFVAGIAGLMVPPAAAMIALPATWLLTYMTATAEYLAGLPWAQLEVELPWWTGAVYYAVLGMACWYMRHRTRYDLRDSNIFV